MRTIRFIALFFVASLAVSAFGAFSVDLPIVTRSRGATTTFYTSIDITNHAPQPTDVSFEYISADLSIDVSGTLVRNLGGRGNFHQDDLMLYLASIGAITADQANSTFGTMSLTFENPSFVTGSEASATARVYNYLVQGQRPSIGLAYRAIPLRKSGSHTLSSIVSNTTAADPSIPSVVTNMGLENAGINDSGEMDTSPVTLQLTFYDPRSGAQVGPQPTLSLAPGQVTQLNDLWARYQLPADATNLLVVVTETSGTAQIRGYISVKDTFTNDGSFFFMQ
jgi:hypothetical protein